MNTKQSISDDILETLWEVGEMILFLFPRPFETKYAWAYRLRKGQDGSYRQAVNRLKKKGYIEIVKQNGKKFLKLTSAGEVEALVQKAAVKVQRPWDGKWRIVMFDMPKWAKDKRVLLRSLLLKNHFKKLQHSVYITPYALNTEGLEYLKRKGLINFIRVARVDLLDDDSDLRKHFKLK